MTGRHSLLLLFLLSTWSCLALNCPPMEPAAYLPTSSPQLRADKFDDFDWDLCKELNKENHGNMVVSPISLKVVLAALYEGASGETAREIADALDLSPIAKRGVTQRSNSRQRFSAILKSLQTSEGQYKIKMGTHVFIDKSAQPKEAYQCKLQQYYNSDMESVDFSDSAAAVKVINNWASKVTEGHIQHLISEAEAKSSTIMLLLNAVYFKGLWEKPFPQNQTKEGHWHLNGKNKVPVPMMNTTDDFAYINLSQFGAQMIRLPYMGGKFAMYLLLPDNNTGLDSLVELLGPDRPLTQYLSNMRMETVNLIMPKFEFDFTTSLRRPLEKLNMTTMFSTAAELNDIADTATDSLVVSNVLQKAGISVTEVGTVAYAATVVELLDKFGGDQGTVEFKADHPFLFFIREESVNTTVFVGKVVDPSSALVVNSTESHPPQPTRPDQTDSASQNGGDSDPGLQDKMRPDTNRQPCAPGVRCGVAQKPVLNNAEQDILHERFNFFDAEILKDMGSHEQGNFVFSPASIKSVLGLLLEGAEGATREQLINLMRLPHDTQDARSLLTAMKTTIQRTKSSNVTVDSVAQAFVSKALTPNMTYANNLKALYDAEVNKQDFSMPNVAANYINSWVNSRTRGLIPSIVEPDSLSPDTYAMLVSALYFAGKWKEEFHPHVSTPGCFFTEGNGACLSIQMMAKTEELMYKLDRSLDAHVVQIPYEDDRYSMVIVMPRAHDGIGQLTVNAAKLSFPALLEKLTLYEVHLKMPRFTMEHGSELSESLARLGLADIFGDKASLPYMFKEQKGRVSEIYHKAKIEVTEQGTKAAAATGSVVVPLMYGLDRIVLEMNHPFYYFIYERESQSVLFAGRLSKPTTAGQGRVPLRGQSQSQPQLEPLGKPNHHGPVNQPYEAQPTNNKRQKYSS